jgi:hypothetical protein
MAILFLIMMLSFSIVVLNYRVKKLEEQYENNEITGKEIDE